MTLFQRFATCAALLVVASCGGDHMTGPDSIPLAVDISVANANPAGTTAVVNSVSRYRCQYILGATGVNGSAGDMAVWTGATGDFTLKANGAKSALEMSAQDLQDWFGVDRVRPNAALTANRLFDWSGPFTLVVTFRYRLTTKQNPSGEDHSDKLFLSCN